MHTSMHLLLLLLRGDGEELENLGLGRKDLDQRQTYWTTILAPDQIGLTAPLSTLRVNPHDPLRSLRLAYADGSKEK